MAKNNYAGFQLGPGARIESVDASIDPHEFYDKFVAPRKPCLVRGVIPGSNFAKWTLPYVTSKAGEGIVSVEHRESPEHRFGRGRLVNMPFKELSQRLEAGSPLFYLTTQDLGVGADGRANLMGTPVQQLQGDFPLRPRLLEGLVPMSYNLWMGNSAEGASSGLHHDYHDNLYVLLHGRKRFRLYSPADTANLYPRGTVALVHPNGRICYAGALTLPDGTNAEAAAADEMQAQAEARLAAAQQALEAQEENAEELMREAEEEMEAALDAVLGAELGGEGDDDFDENEEEEDDGEDPFDGLLDDEDQAAGAAPAGKTSAKRIPVLTKATDEKALMALQEVPPPVSFSKINTALPAREIARSFPRFAKARSIDVDVRAGEMLFLPSGWFHEVTSFSEPGKQLHMAFNYWFHPPTALTAGRAHSPYDSQFWPREWAARGLPTPAAVLSGAPGKPVSAISAREGSDELSNDEEDDVMLESESEGEGEGFDAGQFNDDVLEELTSQGLLDFDLAAAIAAQPTLTHTLPLIHALSTQVAERVMTREKQRRRRGVAKARKWLIRKRKSLFTYK
eukprot:m.22214 g.22214  ORF g.22214 m.22214 type:complete len:566 (+) comp8266_c0_seq2:131-1828(+)